MTSLRIGLAIVVAMIGTVRADDAVPPAAEPGPDVKEAAKRDADALGWLLKRGLRAVVPVPVPPVPAAPMQRPELQEQINQQAKQLERMLDPVLASELEIIRIACDDLDPAARKVILKAGREARTKAARDMAQRQMQGRLGQDNFDPRKEIRSGLAVALRGVVKPEQFARYEQENEARAARQAHAAQLRIVARVDQQLDLSAVQREQIEKSIETQWKPEWIVGLADSGLINDMPIAPDFAKDAIEPHLAPAQQTAWKTWCRSAGSSMMGRRFFTWNFDGQGIQGDDPWWER
jgi:hypothetical protein